MHMFSNTQRGFTQNIREAVLNQGHPRLRLSGMTNKINCHAELSLFSISSTVKTQGRDPEQQRLRMTLFSNNGFTLIELLVVVLIIGILAAIAVPQYQKAVRKSRIIAALPLLNSVYQSQKFFYLTNGVYADTFRKLEILPTDGGKINKAGNEIDYEIYTLNLCSPSSCNGGSIQLTAKKSPRVEIEFYYDPTAPLKPKYCRADPKDAVADKLCQTISGKQNYVRLFSWTWHAYEMD